MINICFHGIGTPRRRLEPGEDRYWISEDFYARVLDEISGRTDVHLSFDDGNVSDIEIGLTRLQEHRRTATFFVLAGRLDLAGSLSAEDVGQLVDSGMQVGSHGMDHRSWRSLSKEEQHREFVDARQRISEAAGSGVDEAAFPLGQYDRRALHQLRRLGYRRVYSSDRRAARAQSWLQPRFSVRADDTVEVVRASVLTPQRPGQVLTAAGKGILKRMR